jgi:hypothetical protein
MPACAQMISAMQEATQQRFETGPQHKEVLDSRIQRNIHDYDEMKKNIENRTPFIQQIQVSAILPMASLRGQMPMLMKSQILVARS